MKTLRTFAWLGGLLFTVMIAQARSTPEFHVATLRLSAVGTNDSGAIKSIPFSGKFLVALTSEGDGFSTRGLALAFDHAGNELDVVNTTNQNVEARFMYFQQAGEAVTSANGTQQQRLMNVYLADNTYVGTAVFVERFTFNDAHEETGYSLSATLQINLPPESGGLSSDRPTIMTGKLAVGKKL